MAKIENDLGVERLAQAVVLAAIKDAKGGDQAAAGWLKTDGLAFLRATGWRIDQKAISQAIGST